MRPATPAPVSTSLRYCDRTDRRHALGHEAVHRLAHPQERSGGVDIEIDVEDGARSAKVWLTSKIRTLGLSMRGS